MGYEVRIEMPHHAFLTDSLASDIYFEYCDIAKDLYGISRDNALSIGWYGKQLFSAEYAHRGNAAYGDSIGLALRNSFYSMARMVERWKKLEKLDLRAPVLDYGCGVGFTLVWLKHHGHDNLLGYEIQGIQRTIMREMFKRYDIREYEPGDKVNTVLCLNVLEHMEDPVSMLATLRSICPRVYANVDMDDGDPVSGDHEHSHIAPMEQRQACVDSLAAAGGLFGEA